MKKIISMAIVVTMLAVILSACGGSSAPASSSTASSTGESTATVDYPTKAINMVVPYGAGGTTDINARMFAAQLEKQLGQSITIINQTGASGSIGTKYVLDQKADGYTIFYSAETLGLFQTMKLSDISYNDFTPIAVTVNDPKMVVVAANSPYNTLEDLLAAIKENPGKIQMSHTGVGSSGHIQSLVYNACGYEIATTPYDGGSNSLLAVLGGQVAFTNANLSTVLDYITSGELKALAVFSDTRLEVLPEIPAFSEVLPESASYVNIPFTPQSVLVAKDTPEAIVEVIRAATAKAFEEEDWINFVTTNNYDLLYKKYPTVDDMNKFTSEWSSIVSYLLYDNGVANANPADFGIERQ